MLGWRLGISAVLIPALLAMFWLDAMQGPRATILLALCSLLAVRCCYEMTQMLSVRSMSPSFALTAICSLLVVFAGWIHTLLGLPNGPLRLLVSLGMICAALVGSFALLFLREAERYRQPGHSLESLGAGWLTVMYSGGLLAIASQLRWFPSPHLGYFTIGSMIIAVKSGDITAYAFGRLWGRRKMAPALSPGKTWMGAAGAVAGSVAGSVLWLRFGGRLFESAPVISSYPAVIGYGIAMGLVGLAGDLCESLLKRDAQQKDSAALMPGFGGVLDLLDSILFAAPVALAIWALWPPAVPAITIMNHAKFVNSQTAESSQIRSVLCVSLRAGNEERPGAQPINFHSRRSVPDTGARQFDSSNDSRVSSRQNRSHSFSQTGNTAGSDTDDVDSTHVRHRIPLRLSQTKVYLKTISPTNGSELTDLSLPGEYRTPLFLTQSVHMAKPNQQRLELTEKHD
ncbi:MAG: phosphatidate cytidylyltransferase [Fuerstiella sp.]|nr:phosphatidate cytidylyltransferase [Fuerstiella sp.]